MPKRLPPHILDALAEVDPALAAEIRQAKPSKYHNKPTVVGGRRFASGHEADCYAGLCFARDAGGITDLRCQVRYALHALGGGLVGHYVADFTYRQDGALVVIDAKGMRTQLYDWKRRHMKAEHGIEIQEV